MLAQKIFALILADLFLHLLVNFRAELQDFQLLGQFTDQNLQPLAHARRLDQFLAQERGKRRQHAGDEIGKLAGILDAHGLGLQIVGELWRVAHNFAEQVQRVALQGLQFRVHFTDNVRLGLHLCLQEWPQAHHVDNLNPLQPFEKDHYVAVRHFYRFVHTRQRSHLMEVGGSGVFNPRIELGNHPQQFVLALQRTYQCQRAFPSHGQRQHSARKEHRIAYWQDCQKLWHRKPFLSHILPSLSRRLHRAPSLEIRCGLGINVAQQ